MHKCTKCNDELTDANWRQCWKKVGRKECKACGKKADSKSNPTRLRVGGKNISKKSALYQMLGPGNFPDLTVAMFDSTVNNNSKEGYVYIIINKAWPDWVKIGMATDVKERLKQFQTASPHRDYEVAYSVYSVDRAVSESEAHAEAKLLGYKCNKEWFNMTVAEAKNILDNLNGCDGLSEEANANPKKDKLQEQPSQASFGF